MENVQNRKRSFDVNSLSKDAADKLSEEIGAKVRQICDEACEKANKILNIYGMEAKMQIVINAIGQDVQEAPVEEQENKSGI
jgi:hypothetical protein